MTTNPHPSEQRVAEVVGRLSEAQGRAIIGWMREYADPNTIRSIRRKGLAVRATLTPFGLAVRASLLSNKDQ